jgi:predicted HD phosphohydrolase
MGETQIRHELYQFIDEADERLLILLYTVAKEYTQEDFTKPGEPLSKEALKKRILNAKSRIKAGQFTTHEDLEKEFEIW